MNGYRLINQDVLDKLIINTIHPVIVNQDSMDMEPDFLPDEQMGEGQASPEEHDYRSELLGILALSFPVITGILQNKELLPEQKISQIDNELSSFTTRAEALIGRSLPQTWKDAVTEANNKLKELKPGIKDVKADKNQLQLIEAQQNNNIQDISNFLRGRLTQGLMMDEIDGVYGDHQSNIDYLNPAFNGAQNRLDQMGMYGYLKTHHLGMLTGLMAGSLIMGALLIADWVTMGDDKVCDECQEMEAGSPYSVMEWPEERHFGDRCWMDNIRIEGT